MSFRHFIEQLIGRANSDKFCKWAFGRNWKNFKEPDQFARVWNDNHGDLFLIKMNAAVSLCVPEMIKLWRLHKTS